MSGLTWGKLAWIGGSTGPGPSPDKLNEGIIICGDSRIANTYASKPITGMVLDGEDLVITCSTQTPTIRTPAAVSIINMGPEHSGDYFLTANESDGRTYRVKAKSTAAIPAPLAMSRLKVIGSIDNGFVPMANMFEIPNAPIIPILRDVSAGGDRSNYFVDRVAYDVLPHKPKYVVLEIAANDIISERNPDGIMMDIESITNQCASIGAKMVLCAVIPFTSTRPVAMSAAILEVNTRLRAYAQQTGNVYVDLHTPLLESGSDRFGDPKYYSDNVHLNTVGQCKIAPIMSAALLALPITIVSYLPKDNSEGGIYSNPLYVSQRTQEYNGNYGPTPYEGTNQRTTGLGLCTNTMTPEPDGYGYTWSTSGEIRDAVSGAAPYIQQNLTLSPNKLIAGSAHAVFIEFLADFGGDRECEGYAVAKLRINGEGYATEKTIQLALAPIVPGEVNSQAAHVISGPLWVPAGETLSTVVISTGVHGIVGSGRDTATMTNVTARSRRVNVRVVPAEDIPQYPVPFTK